MNVTIVGNLCADPELRHTPGGVAVADLRVAENRNYKDTSGEWQQATSYYSVVTWRTLAEHTAASLQKGDRVVAVGRMRQDEWTTDTGETRRRYLVDADELAASIRFATVEVHKPERPEPAEPKDYATDDPERPFED
ncbi:MAG TPA: single-stranded DNA-binding protein [Actinobacteria bacterium]|nr:single-stranded DNA-binding protein [bacterium BMS3Bbin01]HDH26969.1 single-stranded DNA-binding protein [Actinomycetota bacterium]